GWQKRRRNRRARSPAPRARDGAAPAASRRRSSARLAPARRGGNRGRSRAWISRTLRRRSQPPERLGSWRVALPTAPGHGITRLDHLARVARVFRRKRKQQPLVRREMIEHAEEKARRPRGPPQTLRASIRPR